MRFDDVHDPRHDTKPSRCRSALPARDRGRRHPPRRLRGARRAAGRADVTRRVHRDRHGLRRPVDPARGDPVPGRTVPGRPARGTAVRPLPRPDATGAPRVRARSGERSTPDRRRPVRRRVAALARRGRRCRLSRRCRRGLGGGGVVLLGARVDRSGTDPCAARARHPGGRPPGGTRAPVGAGTERARVGPRMTDGGQDRLRLSRPRLEGSGARRRHR